MNIVRMIAIALPMTFLIACGGATAIAPTSPFDDQVGFTNRLCVFVLRWRCLVFASLPISADKGTAAGSVVYNHFLHSPYEFLKIL